MTPGLLLHRSLVIRLGKYWMLDWLKHDLEVHLSQSCVSNYIDRKTLSQANSG